MFEIQPPMIVKHLDADASDLHGVSAPPTLYGHEGTYYGHEWARWGFDSLDEQVDGLLGSRRPMEILDVGCATGARAAGFAAVGHKVTAVDIVDRSRDIATRNRDLPQATAPRKVATATRKGCRPIAFLQADLRRATASCIAGPFHVIHARRVMNFMTIEDVQTFLALVRTVPRSDGFFTASFIADDVRDADQMRRVSEPGCQPPSTCPGLCVHRFSEVHGLLRTHGFRVTEVFSDRRIEAGLIARFPPG